MNDRIVCFFHRTDLDGHASGALVKIKYPDAIMIGIDYADNETVDRLLNKHDFLVGATIYMVDFSLSLDEMKKLSAIAKKLIWMDHHQSAIKQIIPYNIKLPIENMETHTSFTDAGCEIVWKALFANQPGFGSELPAFILRLGRYDVWEHGHPDTLAFQYGMLAEETNPQEIPWVKFNESGELNIWQQLYIDFISSIDHDKIYQTLVSNGRGIMKFVQHEHKEYVNQYAFDCQFKGIPAIAVNRLRVNSSVFNSIWNPDKYKFMIAFGWTGTTWRFSLYTTHDDIDMSDIAKQISPNGGGHRKAAGFSSEVYPFVTYCDPATMNKTLTLEVV